MPAVPAWHSRLGAIRADLDRVPLPVLDRAAVERLFGLRRRQAIRLMAACGGWQAGRAFLIERGALAARLAALADKRPVAQEMTRRRRLDDTLQVLAREFRPRTAVLPPAAGPGWPAEVRVAPGELRIAFSSPEHLLGSILALTEAAVHDLDAFAARLAGGGTP
jgi:hypothetical protein